MILLERGTASNATRRCFSWWRATGTWWPLSKSEERWKGRRGCHRGSIRRCSHAGGLDQGPRKAFRSDALATAHLGSADTQKGPRVTSRELSFYEPRYIGDATPSIGCG